MSDDNPNTNDGSERPSTVRPEKEWTLMFYFASDNPLAPGIVSQMKMIKDAGFHQEANVIARFDPHTLQTPTHVFDVNIIQKLDKAPFSDVGFTDNDPFVRNLVSDKLWRDEDVDLNGNKIRQRLMERFPGYNPPEPPSGARKDMSNRDSLVNRPIREPDPEHSLASFLQFCGTHYPARHFALFILGHGIIVGNDLFLFDQNAEGRHSIKLKELGDILRDFSTQKGHFSTANGKKLDLVSFHCCSMSGLEVAYELKDSVNYMLASQGPAFVGSWPYRSILVRIFNDLNSSDFTTEDLGKAPELASRILAGDDPVSSFILQAGTSELREALEEIGKNGDRDGGSIERLANELNKFLNNEALFDPERFKHVSLPTTIQQIGTRPLGTKDRRRLNRQLLVEAFPEQLVRIDIKKMLSRIFYYCLYNSFDFQLAGYSFDVALSDLTKLSTREFDAKGKVDLLSTELFNALPQPTAPDKKPNAFHAPLMDLIQLAHLKSQSYWDENYIDLYDFCFCLSNACVSATVDPSLKPTLTNIQEACEGVMKVLKRGTPGDDDGLIVRSESAGPSYQYSHGLSLYFPWTRPIASDLWEKQYADYALMQHETTRQTWKDFLDRYFDSTMRKVRETEADVLDQGSLTAQQDPDAALLEDISRLVFNEFGQLKDGSKDTTGGKDGSRDPTGDDCDCATIKNFPPFTRRRKNPSSPHFFDSIRIL